MQTILDHESFWMNEHEKKQPFVFRGGKHPVAWSLDDIGNMLRTTELLEKDIYIIENVGGQYVKDYYVGHSNPEATWVEKVEEVNQAFRNRFIIKIQGIEHWDGDMVRICNRFEEKISGHIDVHLFLAPSKGGSFGLHTDPNDVFVYVLWGRKQFELPEFNLNVELTPGDWLYIPKNAQHKGFSLSNSAMLSFGVREYLCNTTQVPLPIGPWYSTRIGSPSKEFLEQFSDDDYPGHTP